ncbi:hypothetical protein FDECE_8794 [Fusarium decemcellulare]|nr:hypothetical protein FDECE_8794 [Fusarium decemcellulare]
MASSRVPRLSVVRLVSRLDCLGKRKAAWLQQKEKRAQLQFLVLQLCSSPDGRSVVARMPQPLAHRDGASSTPSSSTPAIPADSSLYSPATPAAAVQAPSLPPSLSRYRQILPAPAAAGGSSLEELRLGPQSPVSFPSPQHRGAPVPAVVTQPHVLLHRAHLPRSSFSHATPPAGHSLQTVPSPTTPSKPAVQLGVLDHLPSDARQQVLGSAAVNHVISDFDSPAEVDLDSVLAHYSQPERDQALRGLDHHFDKLNVAQKQLRQIQTPGEKRAKERRESAVKNDDKRSSLDRAWPGWLPPEVHDSCQRTGVPPKVIDYLYDILQELQKCEGFDSFALDSLWAPTGIFRQALRGQKNENHFTRDIACVARKRIKQLLQQGGIAALRVAQAAGAETPLLATQPSTTEAHGELEADQDFVGADSPPAASAFSIDGGLEDTFGPDCGVPEDSSDIGAYPLESAAQISISSDLIKRVATPVVQTNLDVTIDSSKQLADTSTPALVQPASLAFSPGTIGSQGSPMPKPSPDKHDGEEKGLKRKRSQSPEDRASRQKKEAEESSLTPQVILEQLTQDLMLTDEVLTLLCKAVELEYSGKEQDIRVLNPLWFYDDNHSPHLPQAVRSFKDARTMCFPIHHAGNHWALGVLESLATGFFLSYYDSLPAPGRFEEVSNRVRLWLDASGHRGKELAYMDKKCPRQNDAWSCGVHVLICLRMVLQRKACPDSVDIKAEKGALVELLRGTDTDHRTYKEWEVCALKGLREAIESEKLASFGHRLSLFTLDDLEKRLAAASSRYDEAKAGQRQALLDLAMIQGRRDMRDEMHRETEKLMQSMQVTLKTHCTEASQMSSDLSSRRSSRSFPVLPGGNQSQLDEALSEQLYEEEDKRQQRQQRDQTGYHRGTRNGISWLANKLKGVGGRMEDGIAAAKEKLSAAEAELEAALSEVEGCRNAVTAKKNHDDAEMVQAMLTRFSQPQEKDRRLWADGKVSLAME